jgi:hypothetical protein
MVHFSLLLASGRSVSQRSIPMLYAGEREKTTFSVRVGTHIVLGLRKFLGPPSFPDPMTD